MDHASFWKTHKSLVLSLFFVIVVLLFPFLFQFVLFFSDFIILMISKKCWWNKDKFLILKKNDFAILVHPLFVLRAFFDDFGESFADVKTCQELSKALKVSLPNGCLPGQESFFSAGKTSESRNRNGNHYMGPIVIKTWCKSIVNLRDVPW